MAWDHISADVAGEFARFGAAHHDDQVHASHWEILEARLLAAVTQLRAKETACEKRNRERRECQRLLKQIQRETDPTLRERQREYQRRWYADLRADAERFMRVRAAASKNSRLRHQARMRTDPEYAEKKRQYHRDYAKRHPRKRR